jgi:hypothetical protein
MLYIQVFFKTNEKEKGGAENKRNKNRKESLEESKTSVKLDNIFKNVEKKAGDRVGSLKAEVGNCLIGIWR